MIQTVLEDSKKVDKKMKKEKIGKKKKRRHFEKLKRNDNGMRNESCQLHRGNTVVVVVVVEALGCMYTSSRLMVSLLEKVTYAISDLGRFRAASHISLCLFPFRHLIEAVFSIETRKL